MNRACDAGTVMTFSKLAYGSTLVASLTLGTLASGQSAAPLAEIDLPAQPLGSAVREFVSQTGVQVSVETALVAGRRSNAVRGASTPREALDQMLAGSGLVVERVATSVFVLRAATPASPNEDGILELDEIVVSETFLGRTPGASGGGAPFDAFEEARTIETIGGEEIERADLGDIADAIDTAANVVVTNQFNPTTFEVTVRGISDVGNVNATAPTVGLFVDGVLLNQSGGVAGTNPGLVDTERVDVFLGPQTTTFGRATTAGAVNVVTKKPTNDLEFSAEGDIGLFTDDVAATGSATFVANAPILENGLLSGRLVGFVNASGGFIEVFGADPAERIESEGFGTRLSLRSQPTENLTLDLQVDYSRVEFDAISQVSLELLEEGEFVTFTDSLGEDRNDSVLVRFASLYDTDFGTFSSNSAFRFSETFSSFDVDGLLAFDLTVGSVTTATTSFSQDFRFDGLPTELTALPGEIVFDAGVSFNLNNFFSQNTADLAPIGGPGFGFLITDDEQDLLNVSAFADAAWRPIPDLELSAGLRYAFDRVQESDETLTTGPAVELGLLPGGFSETGEASFHSVTPRAAVSYDWSDDLATYFSFATGFRPGGISETEFSGVFEFDEEVTRTFEVGVRSRFLDNRLALNASAFFTKINDFQTPIFVTFPGSILPPQIILDNAGDATSIGGEINIAARPIDGLLLRANAGVNFTEIKEFNLAPPGSGGEVTDLSGLDLPNAPKFTLTLSGDYEFSTQLFGNARPFVRADYSLRTDFIGSISAEPTGVDGFDTLDLRAGLRGDRYSIEVFAENVLDERFATTGTPGPGASFPFPIDPSFGLPPAVTGPVGVPGAPRLVGVRAKITF